jgi:hypothetical protein
MTGQIEQSREHEIEASPFPTSAPAISAVRPLQIHRGLQEGAIPPEPHAAGVTHQFQSIPKLLGFLVSHGYLRLTTEHAEAWKPLREAWRVPQEDQDDPEIRDFRNDVARIYDRAVKRAVHALENLPRGDGRLKELLEKHRYESLPPFAQGAAVERTIETLDRLVRESESREEAKRLEEAKATVQAVVGELVNRGFLAVTHEFRMAYDAWRAKGKSADEEPGDPARASEEAAAKKTLQVAAVACYKVAIFAAANFPDPTVRDRFQPYRTRRLTPAETNWIGSEVRHVLERLLFQVKPEHTTSQSRETDPALSGEAQASDTFPNLAAPEVFTTGMELTSKPRVRGGARLTGALLLAETIGVAIGGAGGFLAGQRFEADKAAARMSADRALAQQAIDDVTRKANRLAEMNLQLAAENKTLQEALVKHESAPARDLAQENADLSRINQALGKKNQELAERVAKQDQTLDALRSEKVTRPLPKNGRSDRKRP